MVILVAPSKELNGGSGHNFIRIRLLQSLSCVLFHLMYVPYYSNVTHHSAVSFGNQDRG